MNKIHANLVLENSIVEGEVYFDSTIKDIKILNDSENKKLKYLMPAFIDLHVHGGGGFDFSDVQDNVKFENAVNVIEKTHLSGGTAYYLATTVSSTFSDLHKIFQKLKLYTSKRCLGVHLEGPFIDSLKKGAHNSNNIRNLNVLEIQKLHEIFPIRIITLSPGAINKDEFKSQLIKIKEMGIIIQLGHSNASYEECIAAFDCGVDSVTHLFNAMSPLHHRSPGVVGASLAHAKFAEIIPDMIHVHPGAIRVATRCIPNIYFVTDGTSASGMPDGQYELGNQAVMKCQNGVRLNDGTLAGSCLLMSEAVFKLLDNGFDLVEIARRTSAIQAELLGIKNIGKIKQGYGANFVVLDLIKKRNRSCIEIIIEGKRE